MSVALIMTLKDPKILLNAQLKDQEINFNNPLIKLREMIHG